MSPPLDAAVNAIGGVIAGRRHIAPIKITNAPVLRVAFNRDPSWACLSLLHAFSYDASFVFMQNLSVTDAYFGCLEVDFEPTDTSQNALSFIASKILHHSDFDPLVVKYDIIRVRMFNFLLDDPDYAMYFDTGGAGSGVISAHAVS